jgi:kinesin family protein 2/24
MQPLPMRATADIFQLMGAPQHTDLQLWLSYFEIYGGKVYDLLNDRRKLCMREDGRQQVG